MTRTCERLHQIAELETEIYGEIVSPEAAEHIQECHIDHSLVTWTNQVYASPRPDRFLDAAIKTAVFLVIAIGFITLLDWIF